MEVPTSDTIETSSLRFCPLCHSRATLSPSHRRKMSEDLLAVGVPVLRPFRCSACNWRGLGGTFAIVPKHKANIVFNLFLYGVVVAGAVFLLDWALDFV